MIGNVSGTAFGIASDFSGFDIRYTGVSTRTSSEFSGSGVIDGPSIPPTPVRFTIRGSGFRDRNERRDTFTDFNPAADTIVVSALGFGGGLIAGASLPLAQFRLGSRALDASDRLIYNFNPLLSL